VSESCIYNEVEALDKQVRFGTWYSGPGFWIIDANVIQWTLGFACFVMANSIFFNSLSSVTAKMSGIVFTMLFFTPSFQQLYSWAS